MNNIVDKTKMLLSLNIMETTAFAIIIVVAVFSLAAIVLLARQTFLLTHGIKSKFSKNERRKAVSLLRKIRIGSVVYFGYFMICVVLIKYFPYMTAS